MLLYLAFGEQKYGEFKRLGNSEDDTKNEPLRENGSLKR